MVRVVRPDLWFEGCSSSWLPAETRGTKLGNNPQPSFKLGNHRYFTDLPAQFSPAALQGSIHLPSGTGALCSVSDAREPFLFFLHGDLLLLALNLTCTPLVFLNSVSLWRRKEEMSTVQTERSADGVNAANGGGLVYDDKDSSRPEDLSEMLAAGTKEVHEKAENTQFVKDFLHGRINKELFKLGAVALYYTYTAMEEEIERNKDHPSFAPLYFPTELHRHEALAQDLEFFYGQDWQSQVSCSPATQHYVDRIHEVGQNDPALLVAHAYTRYMGDLSGGQVLKKVAQRALKLPPTGEGLMFYQFDGIHSAKAFKQLYRSRMNELELNRDTKEKIVREAVLAFEFNMEIFQELEKIETSVQEDVVDAGPIHSDMQGDISKCPYYSAKMAASGGSEYVCQMAMAFLRNPTGQVLLAAWIAALAGLAAWYLI